MPVLVYPDRLFLGCAGDVVIPTDRRIPPLIFNALWSVENIQWAIPVKLLYCLMNRLWFRKQPERALPQWIVVGMTARIQRLGFHNGIFREVLATGVQITNSLQSETAT